MTRNELFEIIKKLNLAYGNNKFPVSEDMIDVWFEMIGEYPFDDIQEAVKRYVRNSEYPPTIAGIMKYYNEFCDERADITAQLNDGWSFCHSVYPSGFETPDSKEVFFELADNDPCKATLIATMTADYVRQQEDKGRAEGKEFEVLPLTEFLRSLKKKK